MSFNSLLYINVCFMAMILHVLFLKLLKLLTCYLVFEVNVYIQIKALGSLDIIVFRRWYETCTLQGVFHYTYKFLCLPSFFCVCSNN